MTGKTGARTAGMTGATGATTGKTGATTGARTAPDPAYSRGDRKLDQQVGRVI